MTKSQKRKLRDAFFAQLGPNVESFKEMFDTAPMLCFYMKDVKGRIMALNQRNCDVCNIKDEWDAIGRPSSDIFPDAYAQDYLSLDQEVLRSGQPVVGRLTRYPADRSLTVMISNVYPLFSVSGEIVGTARAYRLATDTEVNSLRYGQIRQIAAFIDTHYAEDLSLPMLIEMSGLSKNNFIRAFSETFNMTPWHYLTTIRLNAARNLLESTDKLLSIIASETGFYDQSHLAHVFRQERGMTPGEYRRLHRRT